MIDPTTMLAITAGSATTAGAALLAVIVTVASNRRLKRQIRSEDRKRLDWLKSVVMPELVEPKLTRIPKGQPGAGRFISTKETIAAAE